MIVSPTGALPTNRRRPDMSEVIPLGREFYAHEKLLISPAWRGFHLITGNPSVVTSAGCSGTGVIAELSRLVWRENQSWGVVPHSMWLKKALDAAIALTGNEPWRVYALSPKEVEEALLRGEHIDDIRGFANRHEPWQPFETLTDMETANEHGATDESRDLYAKPAEATVWQRVDGWTVQRQDDLTWRAVPPEPGSCIGVPDDHFRTIHQSNGDEIVFLTPSGAMETVDSVRPWK